MCIMIRVCVVISVVSFVARFGTLAVESESILTLWAEDIAQSFSCCFSCCMMPSIAIDRESHLLTTGSCAHVAVRSSVHIRQTS